MSFAPSTNIRLLSVPLDISEKNQINFGSLSGQTSYFMGCTIYSIGSCTYQRKDNYIQVPYNAEVLYNINYVMYQNSNYTSKWFYSFVEKIEYVNSSVSRIYLKTDTWQTWCFNLTFYNSFVVREHVLDDTFGLHTLPEGLDFGTNRLQYMFLPFFSNTNSDAWAVYVVASSDLGFTVRGVRPNYISNLPNACYQYFFNREQFQLLCDYIGTTSGASSKIISMALVPGEMSEGTVIEDATWVHEALATKIMNGYTVKNNKLFTYPYNYLKMSVGGEVEKIYRFERFLAPESTHVDFKCVYTNALTPSISIYPTSYNGGQSQSGFRFTDDRINFTNFPQLAYTYDIYNNYIANHKWSLSSKYVGQIGETVANMATLNLGGVLNTAGSIANEMASEQDMKNLGSQAVGHTTAESLTSDNMLRCCAYEMGITAEYAKMIDDYFTMYGYKVNTVKIPQFNSRPNWNYIETRDVHISADIPQEDLTQICSMFNGGITFWHNTGTFGDYSQNNNL